jgi:hypothetical protein
MLVRIVGRDDVTMKKKDDGRWKREESEERRVRVRLVIS